MVIFRQISEDKEKWTYEYFPEGKTEFVAGLISVAKKDGEIELIQVAESDIKESISTDSLMDMRNAIIEMCIEQGVPVPTEEELPVVTEDKEFYLYADHTMRRLAEDYESGTMKNEGIVMWY